jgi:hypothetical protein
MFDEFVQSINNDESRGSDMMATVSSDSAFVLASSTALSVEKTQIPRSHSLQQKKSRILVNISKIPHNGDSFSSMPLRFA